VPKVFLPKGRVCKIEELDLSSDNPTEEEQEKREDYAKMALIMFYPFRTLKELKSDGSYWKLFQRELNLYQNGETAKLTFWERGFTILQNIQDRMTLEKKMKRVADPIAAKTRCEEPDDTDKRQKQNDDALDILDFCKGNR
jgi:hypothetical protein